MTGRVIILVCSKDIDHDSSHTYEVSHAIYGDFLGEALKVGRYRAAPRARVVGHGLSALQAALAAQKAGVSGEKIVVDLG